MCLVYLATRCLTKGFRTPVDGIKSLPAVWSVTFVGSRTGENAGNPLESLVTVPAEIRRPASRNKGCWT